MGALCSGEKNIDTDVFEYYYGEDDKERMIQH